MYIYVSRQVPKLDGYLIQHDRTGGHTHNLINSAWRNLHDEVVSVLSSKYLKLMIFGWKHTHNFIIEFFFFMDKGSGVDMEETG